MAKNREERLELALKELLLQVAIMRESQIAWKTYYGSDLKKRMERWESKIDQSLALTGIHPDMKLDDIKLTLLSDTKIQTS